LGEQQQGSPAMGESPKVVIMGEWTQLTKCTTLKVL
jgi:hypothetical protein